MNSSLDSAIYRELELARELEASSREVDAVLARLAPPRKSRVPEMAPRPALVAGLVALIALGSVAAAVPQVRSAVEDLADRFDGYFSGDESHEAPGTPVSDAEAPPWLGANRTGGQRLVASAGGHQLYVTEPEHPDGYFDFVMDGDVGIGDTAQGWEREFADREVFVLGPGTHVDENGLVPIFGVAAGNVDHVELRYEEGPPTAAPAKTGGFVALAEIARAPTELVAMDTGGAVLEAKDLGYLRPWDREYWSGNGIPDTGD